MANRQNDQNDWLKPGVFTTSVGHPVADNQNSLTAGEYGPILMSDFHLIDKLSRFDRERIPERVVHAKGSGAHGYFEVTHDITKYCKADFLNAIGKRTPVFARFSTVGGEKGTSDSDRDPRGFALKFYTEDGNFDMVGNNTPVFFIKDPIKFPDFIHTQKRNPQTNLKDPDMFWDYLSLSPESLHQVSILFSDRGTPYGFRHMHGYGSHTYVWVNAKGEQFYVKWHFRTQSGIKNNSAADSDELRNKDPDFSGRDLFDTIKDGKEVAWVWEVQIMPEADAANYKWNVFDVTKVWPHSDYPRQTIGRMILNRNPENFHAEVEQSAFAPAHTVPGIEPSFDKMLQGRLFSYNDTHRHRLGANHNQIPINCPYRTRIHNGERDGPMRCDGNQGSKPNYEPNSHNVFQFKPEAAQSNLAIRGQIGRYKPNHPNCDFAQPGALFRKVFNDTEKKNLIDNLVGHLKGAKKHIQERQVKIFFKADPEYGNRVAEGLGIPPMKHKL